MRFGRRRPFVSSERSRAYFAYSSWAARNGRWGFPKGHIEPNESSHAAKREAFEEAGVSGTAVQSVFGSYTYTKDSGDVTRDISRPRPAFSTSIPTTPRNRSGASFGWSARSSSPLTLGYREN
ncbi:NUDIX domain-containing protein [Pararhizobium sp. PWRC1-1]|uniref:NUDIX domain-containing protein n=1 Tax=Pararhizobium sp. PWRC1-1 TaxID=2804566 RepID=UPI003CFA570F